MISPEVIQEILGIKEKVYLTPTPTTATNYSLQVCADHPLGQTGRGSILEINSAGNAEQNNCLTSPFYFSVVAPITVQLQCEQAGGTFKNDYCVVDYAQTSKLRWTVGGTPTSCSWVQSDVTGAAAKQSYAVTGNPFSLNNLLNKLNFKHQLECVR